MDLPPKLAIPMRVLATSMAILCQLDAHVPTQRLSEELVPGFAERCRRGKAGTARRLPVVR